MTSSHDRLSGVDGTLRVVTCGEDGEAEKTSKRRSEKYNDQNELKCELIRDA